MKKYKHKDMEGLFIPAGLLTGMGVGFILDNVPAGMFIGLGVGMAIYAILVLRR